jgi:hypothetical protein
MIIGSIPFEMFNNKNPAASEPDAGRKTMTLASTSVVKAP